MGDQNIIDNVQDKDKDIENDCSISTTVKMMFLINIRVKWAEDYTRYNDIAKFT